MSLEAIKKLVDERVYSELSNIVNNIDLTDTAKLAIFTYMNEIKKNQKERKEKIKQINTDKKPPSSGFLIYQHENFKEEKVKNPDTSYSDLKNLISAKWKSEDEQTKIDYFNKSIKKFNKENKKTVPLKELSDELINKNKKDFQKKLNKIKENKNKKFKNNDNSEQEETEQEEPIETETEEIKKPIKKIIKKV